LIVGGERALVAHLAAANHFTPSHVATERAQEIIQAAQFYYSAGFFLTVSPESFVQVAEHALAHNKVVCLNLSAPFIVDFFGEPLATALEYADYLFANESEAAAYGKKHQLGEDLKEIALKVAASSKKNTSRPRTVIFTQGSQSTIVACNGQVQEFPVEPLEADKLVDTNGAGDAFVGGFLSRLIQGKDLAQCVKAGHWAARYIIQVSGTTLEGACEY
jgi:adenosine kinase